MIERNIKGGTGVLIKYKRNWEVKPSEITSEKIFRTRRKFLRIALSSAIAIGPSPIFGATQGKRNIVSTQSDVGKKYLANNDEPTDYQSITQYNNFYEFGTGKRDPAENASKFKTRPWAVQISGACEKPGTYGVEDLINFNQLEERIYRFRCVETWSMVVPWVGIPLSKIIDRVSPTSHAKYVSFETLHDPKQMPGQREPVLNWPYKEGLRIDEAVHPLTLLTVGLYGALLPNQNGAPLRIIIPWKYGFKSIKSIVRIHFQADMPATSWSESNSNEYGFYSNVNPDVSHPRWSQTKERRIGEFFKRPTLLFNGYGELVADLYQGMNLERWY